MVSPKQNLEIYSSQLLYLLGAVVVLGLVYYFSLQRISNLPQTNPENKPSRRTKREVEGKVVIKKMRKHSPAGSLIRPKLCVQGLKKENFEFEWWCSQKTVNPMSFKQAKKLPRSKWDLVSNERYTARGPELGSRRFRECSRREGMEGT
jgi:hypothetical protein